MTTTDIFGGMEATLAFFLFRESDIFFFRFSAILQRKISFLTSYLEGRQNILIVTTLASVSIPLKYTIFNIMI